MNRRWISSSLIAAGLFGFIQTGCSSFDQTMDDSPLLKVMSFNLRTMHASSGVSWEVRLPAVIQVIQHYEPDMIGTQEGTYVQLAGMQEQLEHYAWIGSGREGGKLGEHMAVFYNVNRLKPLDSGDFWLSKTPDVPGSKDWGNRYPRMVTWVKFLDLESNKELYLFNTHLDHESEVSRQFSAKLIIEKVNQFEPSLPVVLTGDFNAVPGSYTHDILTGQGEFKDAFKMSETVLNDHVGTFHNFQFESNQTYDTIDWILYRGELQPIRAETILHQADGIYPSDHFPVIAEFRMDQDS